MKILKNQKGFTLLELILTLAILSILAAVLVPSVTSLVQQTRETVCRSNCSQIYRQYLIVSILKEAQGEQLTLQQFLDGQDTTYAEYFKGVKCPSGGHYIVNEEQNAVLCDVHSTTQTQPSASAGTVTEIPVITEPPIIRNTYPGTDILIQDSYWPVESDYINTWDTVYVDAAGLFQYTDGGYYVVTKRVGLTKSQALGGPDAIKQWAEITKISGHVLYPSDLNNGRFTVANNGDIYDDGSGNYYVYTSYNGVDAPAPAAGGDSYWYKLP